jgi:hypothetical protein
MIKKIFTIKTRGLLPPINSKHGERWQEFQLPQSWALKVMVIPTNRNAGF